MENLLKMLLLLAILHSVLGFSSAGDQDPEKDGLLRNVRMDRKMFVRFRDANDPSVFTITEKDTSRAFSWLKALTNALTLKALLRHYAKQS